MDNEFELRLTQQLEDLVRARVSLLEQDISRVQREVNEAFTRLLESTDAAAAVPENNGLLAQISAELKSHISKPEADTERLTSSLKMLRDAVAELGQQPSQAEVLNKLVANAAGFAPRLVLFVVKGTNALAWAARGFEDGIGDTAIRGLSMSLQLNTVLSAALSAQQTLYVPIDQNPDNQNLVGRLGTVRPEHVLAVPLKVRGKAAAVLFADSGDLGRDSVVVEAVELLVNTAGFVIELTSLRARGAAPQEAASRPKAEAPAVAHRVEPPQAHQPSAPLPSPSNPLTPPRPSISGDLRQTAPSVASPRVEAPQRVEAARAGSGPLRPPAADDEEKQHNDAKKFARLLVSEIKLYNESKVVEGRHNSDLYDRLKEDIDRSRQMYEKRVAPDVAAKFDYFYDELVNTLAEGDSAKLGASFPGPSLRPS